MVAESEEMGMDIWMVGEMQERRDGWMHGWLDEWAHG